MITVEIKKAWTYFKKYGFIRTLLSRDTPFLIQFGKYGLCGICSVITFLIVTKLGENLFPEYLGADISGDIRARYIPWLHFAAFIPSNFTAYALNRWLVFTPGRHSLRKEISLFTLISFISFSAGELIPIFLVKNYNAPNGIAHFSFIITSTMVNFVCRKFFVFEK